LKIVVIFFNLWYVIILPGSIHKTPGKGGFAMATGLTKINIELPRDIIFAMRGHKKIVDIKKKLKTSLAIILFQEGSISLGKAAELAEMDRVKFIKLLKEYDLPAYEYSEEDFEKDRQAISEYLEMSQQ
jgi:predicted HTH domain antitoxin